MSRTADQVSSAAPARPTAKPTTRTGSQPTSIAPTRRAISIGGSSHSAGSKTAETYQRQLLIRDRNGDGSIARRSSASAATTALLFASLPSSWPRVANYSVAVKHLSS
ncbi:MAG TPA: hypothetical protein VG125_09135 [Pirellulales bacterium]|jgi:hypothetical protein|nr:hypothetical protein [Pirellulales bacterium]